MLFMDLSVRNKFVYQIPHKNENLSACSINTLWVAFIHSLIRIKIKTSLVCWTNSIVRLLLLLNSWIKSYASIFHEIISIWLISFRLGNQGAQKAVFTCGIHPTPQYIEQIRTKCYKNSPLPTCVLQTLHQVCKKNKAKGKKCKLRCITTHPLTVEIRQWSKINWGVIFLEAPIPLYWRAKKEIMGKCGKKFTSWARQV